MSISPGAFPHVLVKGGPALRQIIFISEGVESQFGPQAGSRLPRPFGIQLPVKDQIGLFEFHPLLEFDLLYEVPAHQLAVLATFPEGTLQFLPLLVAQKFLAVHLAPDLLEFVIGLEFIGVVPVDGFAGPRQNL